jgi:cobalt-zinc-cadmium efflux system protein
MTHHDHSHGERRGRNLLISILLNMGITLAQFIGGILSGSLSLLSDAGHNLSDVLSMMLGYAGEKISRQGPSKQFTFGLKRFEVLIAVINSLSLLVIGGLIVYEAVERYLHPPEVDTNIMIPVALVGLAGNLFSIILLAAHREDNLNLKAAFLHLFYDTLSSVAVVASGIIIRFTGWNMADLVASLVIVLMIAWSSLGILRTAFRIFLQGTPPHLDVDEIYDKLVHHPGVIDVHGLHVWSINSQEVFLSCHIVLQENAPVNRYLLELNELLKEKFSIDHSALQIETGSFCDEQDVLCQK